MSPERPPLSRYGILNESHRLDRLHRRRPDHHFLRSPGLAYLGTKITKGISLRMYVLFTTGVGLWLVYGIVITAWPMILANTITVILAAVVLILKLRHS